MYICICLKIRIYIPTMHLDTLVQQFSHISNMQSAGVENNQLAYRTIGWLIEQLAGEYNGWRTWNKGWR